MSKKFIKLVILILILGFELHASEETIKIELKVGDQIITNYDIIKETNYLKVLNKNLKNKNLRDFAKNSLVKEIIKKKEIEKIYVIDYTSDAVDNIIGQIININKFDGIENFEKSLSKYDLSIEEIRKKIIIEQTWNKLIFDKYNSQIKIDEEKINQMLDEITVSKSSQKSFNLAEIVFIEKNKDKYKLKYEEIISEIKKNNFAQAANLYSVSDTSKLGGSIGWVNQNQLSKQIYSMIENLEPGEYSKPLVTAGGSLILMVNDVKEISFENFDKDEELKKIINSEKNRQLKEYSLIHYRKLENSFYVEEF